MTVAELKRRLTPGTRLTLVHCLMGPTHKHRTVVKSTTVDLIVETPDGRYSHLRWPKASELRETENGFAVLEGGEIAAQYVWGHV